jgi:hypothetical protein
METVSEMLVYISSVCCTLEEPGANCKLIARGLFCSKNEGNGLIGRITAYYFLGVSAPGTVDNSFDRIPSWRPYRDLPHPANSSL